ncbi:MAG: rRNA maturation RNase YbeY [Erysipelothrix sp.]|nr:rRNA maturation RNase YbeY [Erysipelothrix sp.]
MALIINNDVNFDYDFKELFNEVIKITMLKLKLEQDYDLSVSFIDDKQIRVINRDYRHIDKSTDVISFAMLDSQDFVVQDNSDLDLGDIFISVETANKQAKALNQSVNREILFLFIHGLLHLLGYDHQKEEAEKVMIQLQEEILNEVIKKDYFEI